MERDESSVGDIPSVVEKQVGEQQSVANIAVDQVTQLQDGNSMPLNDEFRGQDLLDIAPGDQSTLEGECEASPPESVFWLTNHALSKELERSDATVKKAAEAFRETNPEWFVEAEDATGRKRQKYTPELVEIIRNNLGRAKPAPEGWTSLSQLIGETGKDRSAIQGIIDAHKEENPDWLQNYSVNGKHALHLSPQLASIVKEAFSPDRVVPEDWASITGLANEIGCDWGTVKKAIETQRDEHPEWFGEFTKKGIAVQEYIAPELVSLIRERFATSTTPAPEGWVTRSALSKAISFPKQTIELAAQEFRDEHPEWFGEYSTTRRISTEHYSPELVEQLIAKFSERKAAPEAWQNAAQLAKDLQISSTIVRKLVSQYRDEHPEWFETYRGDQGHMIEHFSPELISDLRQTTQISALVPEEWVDVSELATGVERSDAFVRKRLQAYRDEYPDYVQIFRGKTGRLTEFYSPKLLDLMKLTLGEQKPAPEGWMTVGELKEDLGSYGTIKKLADRYLEEHPEWQATFLNARNIVSAHYHPDLISLMKEDYSAIEATPEGWMTNRTLCNTIGRAQSMTQRLAESLREDHPEWFQLYRSRGKVFEHFSPELITEIQEMIYSDGKAKYEHGELEQLKGSIREFLESTEDSEEYNTGEFRQLIKLFGSERTVDILFHLHPDYKKLPLPYVKSILGDYLGDYLVLRSDFDLNKVETFGDYLSNPDLKEGLTEVIRNDVLRFYNTLKKTFPAAPDQQIIEGYIRFLGEETKLMGNSDLSEVLIDVDSFFQSLFEDIHKPSNLVDQVSPNRMFPDINQRINILKLAAQNKLLIADEMGLGKSASAILAKETLGVKQALIVVPSNVIEVWQTYLSDKRGENNEILGYFNDGQAPRVLTIDNLEALEGINTGDYDYIIISQEKLNKRYMQHLEALDFDMLIVDEAHKLKNITTGKRAEYLIRLAEKINGHEDRYLALLSGTPVPNKVGDIAMTLKLLYPNEFGKVPNRTLTSQILQGDILDLRNLLVPKMEMKSLAESTAMPELHEVLHSVELTRQEQTTYEVLLEDDELTPAQKLQVLRQFILNPEMFDVTPEVDHSKARSVGEELRKTFAEKDKVIMFVNGYVENVIRGESTIFKQLNLPDDVAISIIDGQTTKEIRMEIQQALRQSVGKMLVAVSGQTADVGVDFSGAEELFFYNEPWTEYDRKQQLGRVYRPGLRKDLTSHSFITKGSIEDGIHKYVQVKYNAVEKLLRGIPLSEVERGLLKKDEERADPNLEVNPALAENYFSSWDRMQKIYGYVKEIGEDDFTKFLSSYGQEYAHSYQDLGSRSYQANASRLSGTVIDKFIKARKQASGSVRILDVASGPEMLKRHIAEEYKEGVTSVDINKHHFAEVDESRRVGSFLNLPVEDNSVDYANLSLALHYTKPISQRRQNYERIQVFKELNRALVKDGIAVVSLMHTLDLKDTSLFEQAINKIGFKVVKGYSGEVSSGNNFRTRLIVLQKVSDSPQDMSTLVKSIGGQLMSGFKFRKREDAKLRDSRKIATQFIMGNERKLEASLNPEDQAVLEEEQAALSQILRLKKLYGSIRDIPRELVVSNGLARVFNGKKYILFRRLERGPGAVIVR